MFNSGKEDLENKKSFAFKALDFSQKIEKHSVNIAGHSTSVTLEPIFWQLLKEIAFRKKISLRCLIEEIDINRTYNLSCAIRIHIMEYFLERFLSPS